MKVFVSSTVFDLLDIRALVERSLRSAGIEPMLSDSKLSAFDVTPSANSIETCLLNVDTSDAFVCILDQRYGPSLKNAGFPDISATHLEYQRALSSNKPIHFFVRDRLEADYAIWKRNGRSNSTKLVWAADTEILALLDEHRRLDGTTNRPNWFSTFTAATDLVDALSLRFDREMKPRIILEAMRDNRFPMLSCKLDVEHITVGNMPSLQLRFKCRNVSLSPAFSVRTEWQDERQKPTDSILPPGETIVPTLIASLPYGGDISKNISVSYDTTFGVRVAEVYNVGVFFQGGRGLSIISGATLKSRRFIRSAPVTIEIEEP